MKGGFSIAEEENRQTAGMETTIPAEFVELQFRLFCGVVACKVTLRVFQWQMLR